MMALAVTRKRVIGSTGNSYGDIFFQVTMKTFGKLILGLVALFFITIMTAVFGIGGFFFTLGLYAVIFYAFAK